MSDIKLRKKNTIDSLKRKGKTINLPYLPGKHGPPKQTTLPYIPKKGETIHPDSLKSDSWRLRRIKKITTKF